MDWLLARVQGIQDSDPEESTLSLGANTGVYLVSPRIYHDNWIPRSYATDLGVHLIPELLAHGKDVRAVTLPGPFRDIGTPERLEQAREHYRDGVADPLVEDTPAARSLGSGPPAAQAATTPPAAPRSCAATLPLGASLSW